MLAANGSIFTILAISFERYYAICKPLKAGYKCTRPRAALIICLIWLLACLLTSPILIMAKSIQTTYIDGSLVDNCILETDSYWPKMYVFVSMFAFFCLPLLVLMLVYWLISRRLIRENIAMLGDARGPLIEQCNGSLSQTDTRSSQMANGGSNCTGGGGGGSRRAWALNQVRKTSSLRPLASLFASLGNYQQASRGVRGSICCPLAGALGGRQESADLTAAMRDGNANAPLVSASPNGRGADLAAARARPVKKAFSLDRPAAPNGWSCGTALNGHAEAASKSNASQPEREHGYRESSLLVRLFWAAARLGQLLSMGQLRLLTGAQDKQPAESREASEGARAPNGCTVGTLSAPAACNGGGDVASETRVSQPPDELHRPIRLVGAISCPAGPAATGASPKPTISQQPPTRNEDEKKPCEAAGTNAKHGGEHQRHQLGLDTIGSVTRSGRRKRLAGWRRSRHTTELGLASSSSPTNGPRFRWAKDFSISSSTGSTYTNSTCLASEPASSKSPSLHNAAVGPGSGQRRLSASTPRAIMMITEPAAGPASRSSSPLKALASAPDRRQHKSAHFTGDGGGGGELCVTRPATRRLVANGLPPPRVAPSDSTSSSASGEVGHDDASERSISPSSNVSLEASSSSATVPDCSKSSWLESLALQEQQHARQQQQPLSRHEEEAEEPAAKRPRASDEPHAAVPGRGRRAQHFMRSLTEDRQAYEKVQLIAVQPASAANRFQCGARGSASRAPDSPQANKQHCTGKVNLIALAHNLSVHNFHLKRDKRRSGSQPVVSNHLQNVHGPACSAEFQAVRDISKKQQMDSRRQVVVMLAFVVACFFLLFFPYRVFTIWLILSTEAQVQSLGMETYYNLTYFSRILIYLHSAINPIAYNLISIKFRRAFMSILLCRGKATRRYFTTDSHRHLNECKASSRDKQKVNGSNPRSALPTTTTTTQQQQQHQQHQNNFNQSHYQK